MKKSSKAEFFNGPYAVCYKVDNELEFYAEIYDTYKEAFQRCEKLDTFGKMIYRVIEPPKETNDNPTS